MKSKKILTATIVGALSMTILAGCGDNSNQGANSEPSTTATQTTSSYYENVTHWEGFNEEYGYGYKLTYMDKPDQSVVDLAKDVVTDTMPGIKTDAQMNEMQFVRVDVDGSKATSEVHGYSDPLSFVDPDGNERMIGSDTRARIGEVVMNKDREADDLTAADIKYPTNDTGDWHNTVDNTDGSVAPGESKSFVLAYLPLESGEPSLIAKVKKLETYDETVLKPANK